MRSKSVNREAYLVSQVGQELRVPCFRFLVSVSIT